MSKTEAQSALCEQATIPVIQEEINVQKRQVVTGTVRFRTVVHEREEIVDEPLQADTVQMERVPINQPVQGPVPVRQDGDTTVISIVEEILVVTKHWVLKEEVRITRHISEKHEPQRVTVRSEEVTIERIQGQDAKAPEANRL